MIDYVAGGILPMTILLEYIWNMGSGNNPLSILGVSRISRHAAEQGVIACGHLTIPICP